MGSPSSSVQDELRRSLLLFALSFPSRSRSLGYSFDKIFAQEMTESRFSGSRPTRPSERSLLCITLDGLNKEGDGFLFPNQLRQFVV